MIHVCLCFTDKTGLYSKFVGTTMLSIFENAVTPPYSITVHILHDNTLTDDNRDKFSYLAGRYSQLVKFYNVEEICANKIKKIHEFFPKIFENRLSIAAFYRLFIPQILSAEEKAIYLDSDIIVNLDINELWQIEIEDKPFGAVPNLFQIKNEKLSIERTMKNIQICKEGLVKPEDYFNSGVLLMNLKIMRDAEETLMSGIEIIKEHPKLQYLDQDILNYYFSTSALKLPVKFNRYVMLARPENELAIEKKIYHYAGGGVGLGLNMNDPFNRLWMSYFIRTPFFNADSMGRLYEGFLKIRSDAKNAGLKLSAIVAGKNRAFFVEPAKIDSIKKAFSIRDDEAIIPAENENSIQKLIDAMKITRGKYVFFIMTENFLDDVFPFDLLTKEGFVERIDFIKGWKYLDSPLNSNSLIKAM